MQKVKKRHSDPPHSSKSSDEQRKKHKKRSHSKTRNRTSSTTSQNDDSSPQSKKHKTEYPSTPVKHPTVNGNEKSPVDKKKPTTPYKDRKSEENNRPLREGKHIPHHITSTLTLPTTTITQDATSPSKSSKIYVEQKNPLVPKIHSPKKHYKKTETKSPVDLLDKIMKDMDGKNWNP